MTAHTETTWESYKEEVLEEALKEIGHGRDFEDFGSRLILHACIPCLALDCNGVSEVISSSLEEVDESVTTVRDVVYGGKNG